jgi:hypothetical protein
MKFTYQTTLQLILLMQASLANGKMQVIRAAENIM